MDLNSSNTVDITSEEAPIPVRQVLAASTPLRDGETELPDEESDEDYPSGQEDSQDGVPVQGSGSSSSDSVLGPRPVFMRGRPLSFLESSDTEDSEPDPYDTIIDGSLDDYNFLIDAFKYVDDTTLVESVDICLLYTSPSPRDLSTSRMPSSA